MAATAITACRSCGASTLEDVLDLGETPLADGLVRPEDVGKEEATYPLVVAVCTTCALAQIRHTVPPDELFCRDYPYYSSFSDALLRHSREHALALLESRSLSASSRVVEIASNDGYLLKNFVEAGVPVLGIDPAEGPAKAAQELGVPTRQTFFTRELAHELASEQRADVVLGNNVLAHVPDLRGFVAGVRVLLAPGGVAEFEFPYVRDLVDHVEFDTIYHEHLCYFSVTALDQLFASESLRLTRVDRIPIHGGSLRVRVEHDGEPHESVSRLLEEERVLGFDGASAYRDFATRVDVVRRDLKALIDRLHAAGHRLAAYGAAAKGSTLLNSCGIGRDQLDFVVDRNRHKHGWHMPGVHVPVRPVEALVEEAPAYVLLLAWNFRDEIVAQQSAYVAAGGRFIEPVPTPRVLEPDGA